MTINRAPNPTGVARILYKEIVAGDLRKILAESNDSKTGGGARDFRFGDYETLEPMIRKMFPSVKLEKRRRNGSKIDVQIFCGTFHWEVNGIEQHKEVEFEPPTTARKTEGRITRVHEQPSLDVDRIPKVSEHNRVLLLLLQRNDGTVWPYFIEEASLAIPGAWDPRVAAEILRCINARRASNRAVIGFKDFTTSEGYCNGK